MWQWSVGARCELSSEGSASVTAALYLLDQTAELHIGNVHPTCWSGYWASRCYLPACHFLGHGSTLAKWMAVAIRRMKV